MKRKTPSPTLLFEIEERKLAGGPVAGVDEAGRGPWAGPVVAAAVILPAKGHPEGLADSKVLTADRRELLFGEIMHHCEVGIGIANVARIDRDNILNATLWAMRSAVSKLPHQPACALVDGNRPPRLHCKVRTIIKGDALSLSIAAASIIAKVTRDRIMKNLARRWPGYGFEQHKGYGTAQHQSAIAELGVTPHHRRSFKPIKAALGEPFD